MALDSKQNRGSATEIGMPHRAWLAEPDGTLISTDRVSLLKLCSAVSSEGYSSDAYYYDSSDATGSVADGTVQDADVTYD